MARSVQSFRKRLLLRGLASAFVIAILFGGAEIMTRLFAPQNLSGSWRAYSDYGYSLNKAGGKARHQFGARVVSYRFNQDHLRGASVPDDGTRVLALGDSFTFGWLLEENDTFLHHLQRFSDLEFGSEKVRLLNGGAGGWGTADYVAFVEDFGPKLRPKCILCFINTDDVGRSIKSGLYSLDGVDFDLRRHVIPPPKAELKRFINCLPGYQWMLEHSHAVQFFRSVTLWGRRSSPIPASYGPRSRVPDSTVASGVKLEQALFMRLKQWCFSNDCTLLVTTSGFHQHSPEGENDPTTGFMRTANAFFASQGILYHDISPEVDKTLGGNYAAVTIPNDGHPNESGATMIATNAWVWLRPHFGRLIQ